MEKVLEFLKTNYYGMLASSTPSGEASLRPFMFLFSDEKGFLFTTGMGKEVYRELCENPKAEFCSQTKEYFQWLRIKGNVAFSDSMADRERIMRDHSEIKNVYRSADNPSLKVFRITEGKIYLTTKAGTFRYHFSGNSATLLSK